MRRFILPLIVLISLAWAGSLVAGPMVLTSDGQLYKVWSSPEQGLVLSHVAAGTENEEFVIPQSINVNLETVSVLVYEKTATVFVIWEDLADSISRIRLAVLKDQSWTGPMTLGGESGFATSSPQAMLDTARSVVATGVSDNPDENSTEILETTFLHCVWWQHDESSGFGHAVYLAIPLNEDGLPLINEAWPIDLQDLLPFGFGCSETPDVAGLAHPQFLKSPEGGPLLFTTDFSNCVFHMLQIEYEVVDGNNPENLDKRRRQIAVFRTGDMTMVIPPDVVLTDAKMLLSRDFSILIYWDEDDGVHWIRSDSQGWSAVKVLPIGTELNHEQAVNLLRKLVFS